MEAIEPAYRAGSLSLRAIADKYGSNEGTIRSRAKKHGWQRDLSEQVRSATQGKLNELEAKLGIKRNLGQRAWYAATEKTLGDDMKREYPSIPVEAFQQSIEGANTPSSSRSCTHSSGSQCCPTTASRCTPSGTSASATRRQSGSFGSWDEFHVIDYYENSGEGLRHYMKVLKDRGYTYGDHWGRMTWITVSSEATARNGAR